MTFALRSAIAIWLIAGQAACSGASLNDDARREISCIVASQFNMQVSGSLLEYKRNKTELSDIPLAERREIWNRWKKRAIGRGLKIVRDRFGRNDRAKVYYLSEFNRHSDEFAEAVELPYVEAKSRISILKHQCDAPQDQSPA
jgi:hypothetical protein